MNTSRYPQQACPSCGYKFDAATGLNGADRPSEGAVSICLACGSLGIFTYVLGQLTVRAATPAEHDELIGDPFIRRALATRAATVGDDLRPPTPESSTS